MEQIFKRRYQSPSANFISFVAVDAIVMSATDDQELIIGDIDWGIED